jgi:DNA polymerase-3 subunit alpha
MNSQTPAYAPFVHLRVHSAYSMLEGAMQPAQIAGLALDRRMPAVAVTDRNGLYGAMEFSEACMGAGVQPIVGATLRVLRPSDDPHAAPDYDWLVLLAQDEAGYANLVRLVSLAHMSGEGTDPAHVQLEQLEPLSGGLIALTAGPEGALSRLFACGQHEAADTYVSRLMRLFGGRLYIELSRCGDPVQDAAEPFLIDLAYALGLPLVATNPVCFADPEDTEAHDVMLCIADGAYVEAAERRRSNPANYMRSADEMAELFGDMPEALANTLVVAPRARSRPWPNWRAPVSTIGSSAPCSRTAMTRLRATRRPRPIASG